VDLFSVGFGSSGIEDDELGAGDDVKVDGDKSGEAAGGEGSDGFRWVSSKWVSEWVFTGMRNL
jgi:hypothetical protein